MERPAQFSKMLRIAECLSEDIDFVKVDLYAPNDDAIMFGELTLTPAGGNVKLKREWDFKLGELW